MNLQFAGDQVRLFGKDVPILANPRDLARALEFAQKLP